MTFARRVTLQFCAFAAAAIATISSAMVFTPSSGSVTDVGSASYSVPIQVPPGTAGMVPNLSLSYSSLGTNGLLGMGWSLSGLSVISRCPQTLATDSAVAPVNLSTNDRFCLDGSRLVTFTNYNYNPARSSGVYGADATEYRTEVNSLTKIVSHGTAGTGPAWFQVWMRNGLVYEYGNTADSQVLATGSTTVRTWLVNKVTDLFGNYYTITYTQDAASGSFVPLRIEYTGNVAAGLTPYNKIEFSYETRTDNEPRYYGASLVTQPNRLTHIKTFAEGVLVRDYGLTYEVSPNTSRSRLVSITECAGDGTCMPSLVPSYVVSPGGVSQSGAPVTVLNAHSQFGSPVTQSNISSVSVADFNGDGIDDVYYVGSHGSAQVCYGPTFSTCSTGFGNPLTTITFVGDFDGDGIADRFLVNSDGSMTFCPGPSLTANCQVLPQTLAGYKFAVGDFDGDGRVDVLAWPPNGTGTWICGASGCSPVVGNVSPRTFPLITGDFDGDGSTDTLVVSGNSYTACSQLGSGHGGHSAPCQSVSTPASLTTGNTVLVGDFNGDGKSDLLLLTANGIQFCPGPGLLTTNTCALVPGTSGDWKTPYQAMVGDFDGDGRSDVLLTGASGTLFCSGPQFTSTGTCTLVTSADWRGRSLVVGDFNGDGSSDVYAIGATDNETVSGASHVPDYLGSVTNTAFNVSTSFAYRPLTDTTIHTDGTGPAYPIVYTPRPFLDPARLQRPFFIASQLSVPNGVGGNNLVTYKYEKATSEIDGRGFQGFQVKHATDVARNRETITNYSQTFPDNRRKTSVQTLAAGTLAASWTQTFGSTATCGDGMRIATTADEVDVSYGLDDAWRSEHRVYSSFDCYGNARTVTSYISATSSVVKQTKTLTFNTDSTHWGLSDRLANSVITLYDSLGQNPVTQTTNRTYLQFTRFMSEQVVEPNDTTLKVVTDFTPDAFGHVISSSVSGSDIDTRTTTYGYDSRGRFVLTTTNPLGHVQSSTYDGRFGFVTSSTDPNGITTTRSPDVFGRPALETRADGTMTSWSYGICCTPAYAMNSNIAYQVVTSTTTSTQPTAAYFDSLGRQILSSRRNFADTDWIDDQNLIYDATGPVVAAYLPYERSASAKPSTTTTYDSKGRKSVVTAPDNGTTTYVYGDTPSSPQHNILIIDPRTNHRTFSYGAPNNHLNQVVDSVGTASYFYTALDKFSQIAYAGIQSTFTYNNYGWLTSKVDPDLGSWSYAYDRLGQLRSQTDAKSQVTTFNYDKLGRMLTRVEPSLNGAWTWDTAYKGIGKVASTSTAGGVTRAYAYDALGRPSAQSLSVDGNLFTASFGYDGFGRPASTTYPTGYSVTYNYNGLGYLSEVHDGLSNALIWRAVDMSPAGLSNEDLGNGTGIVTAYDPQTERVSQIAVTRDSDNAVLQNHTYTFDLNGNIASRAETTQGLSESFGYDSLDRLTSVTGPASKTIAYDATGNITSKSDVGTYTYPSTGQVHAVLSAGGVSYSYDANGNMKTSGNKSIGWTSFNMPSTLQIGVGGPLYSWGYDAAFGRAKYATPTNTVYYLDLAGSSVFEQSTQSGLTQNRHYVYAGSHLVAEYISRSDGTTDMHYLISDKLGSIALVLDQSGNPAERLSYDANGKRRFPNGTDDAAGTLSGVATSLGFTAHEQLDDLGLIHMKGRIYDSRVGRFISADPHVTDWSNSQNLNRYAYVLNRPLSLTDPTGFDWSWSDIGIWFSNLWDCWGGGGACGAAGATPDELAHRDMGRMEVNAQRESPPSPQPAPPPPGFTPDPTPAPGGPGLGNPSGPGAGTSGNQSPNPAQRPSCRTNYNLLVGAGAVLAVGPHGFDRSAAMGFNPLARALTGYSTTDSRVGGLIAGSGVSLGLVTGDPSNPGGVFNNLYLPTPIPLTSIDIHWNENWNLQGATLGWGPGGGIADTRTDTVVTPLTEGRGRDTASQWGCK